MKLRLMLIAVGCAFATSALGDQEASGPTVRLSEPVYATEQAEYFGDRINEQTAPVNLRQAVLASREGTGESPGEQLIQTEVSQVCQKKGCFFIARQDDLVARISFKDYGFFIPTDSSGKTVTLLGTVERQALSAEQIAHLEDDLGLSDGGLAPLELNIIASAIKIPRS